ncbi:MAG: Hpt domain-containing protein [Methylobacter sp.]|uniref:Hpt domain-containing protein n=1 Tax=Methylobacter sp. TaxID=2051955 RepID=UPI002730FCB5|nr:Hpt domain-containing protein [Methylobacter sp.]MDP1665479.1 Hpt domain-containing protein [Methylobacter sp.]
MALKPKQHDQFMVLMTGNIDINHLSLKHRYQNIIVTTAYDDILMCIETTPFNLILLDLTVNFSIAAVPDRLRHFRPPWMEEMPRTAGSSLDLHPWQTELITRIKDPLGINNKTPVIAIINPTKDAQSDQQCSTEFDGSLTGPITEQQLNKLIDLWQTKASALDYIQIILSKAKNNRRLTLTLFEKLFEELPSQVIDIKDALENKQYNLAREITHKLNGSASFCGLMDIQQSANALESCLLNNNYASAHQHFLMLQQCILNFTCHQKFILTNLGKC